VSDSEQSSINLSYLNKNLLQIDYVDGLANAFIDQQDKFRSKKIFDHVISE